MESEVIAGIAVAVSAASAWFAWRVSSRPRPKISGRLDFAWHFNLIANDFEGTLVMVYATMTNESPHPVHPTNYELRVDSGDGYRALQGTLGLRERMELPSFSITRGDGVQLEARVTPDALIDWPSKPVEYGAPQVGLFLAFGPREFRLDDAKAYELLVTDIFGSQHKLSLTREQSDRFLSEDSDRFEYLLRHAGVPVERADESEARVP